MSNAQMYDLLAYVVLAWVLTGAIGAVLYWAYKPLRTVKVYNTWEAGDETVYSQYR